MDGSSTAGAGGVGVILLSPEEDILKYRVQLQFVATNNEAEYEAVLTSMRVTKALGVGNLKLKSNSKLVVRQITKEHEAKEDKMKRYLKLTSQLVSNFDDIRITQVPREENFEADEVARLASSNNDTGRPKLYIKVQSLPSIEGLDVIHVNSKGSWMDPIITYIRDGTLSSDLSEAKKIRVRSSIFTILNEELYKRGFSQPYLKCLDSKDAAYVLSEFHEGVCENHSGPQSLVGKVVRAGYFWPTM